jgi:hypothetical protein
MPRIPEYGEAVSASLTGRQRAICASYGAVFAPPAPGSKAGISSNLRSERLPINGLRHPPEGATNGWYIWRGELLQDDAFFLPLHVEHLAEWCPPILEYLALPPGWRFLIADAYVDVWFDPELLRM